MHMTIILWSAEKDKHELSGSVILKFLAHSVAEKIAPNVWVQRFYYYA